MGGEESYAIEPHGPSHANANVINTACNPFEPHAQQKVPSYLVRAISRTRINITKPSTLVDDDDICGKKTERYLGGSQW